MRRHTFLLYSCILFFSNYRSVHQNNIPSFVSSRRKESAKKMLIEKSIYSTKSMVTKVKKFLKKLSFSSLENFSLLEILQLYPVE